MQQEGSEVRDAYVRCVEIITGMGRFVFSYMGEWCDGVKQGERAIETLESHAAHSTHSTAHAHAGGRRLLLSLNNACLGGSEERGNAAAGCICQFLSNFKDH